MSVIGCLSRASNTQSELSFVIRMEVLVSSLTRPISEESIESASLLRSFTHLHLQEISKKYTNKLSGAFSRENISATGFSVFFVIISGSSTSAVTRQVPKGQIVLPSDIFVENCDLLS